MSWGFVDQLLSSATNFGLSVWTGRLLGPSGLGVVFIGISAYFALQGLHRALLTDPLVTASSTLSEDERRQVAGRGLTIVVFEGVLGGAVFAIAGAAIGGNIGHGLLLFVPWLVPLLAQDYWRVVLFRDGRGLAATLNDGSWLVFMAVVAPFASELGSDWAVVAVWAGGAATGAVLGAVQTGLRPASPSSSLRWWVRDAWPLGRWLASTTLVSSMATYATAFVLIAILGARDYGGLEAVTVLFGPLSLIASALAMPGLPAMTRTLAASRSAATTLALGIGALAGVMTTVYVTVLKGASLHGSGLLTVVFGGSFDRFGRVVWPVATGQLFTAVTIGFALLLTAERRGRAILAYATAASIGSLALAASLAQGHGVTGAAWGIAGGFALGALGKTFFALRPPAGAARPQPAVEGTTS